MRNFTLTAALVILLVLPTLGSAATLDTLSGTADCNGWSADMSINFRPGAFFVRVEYSVVLQDAGGAEIDRFDFSEFIEIPGTATASYNFSGAWTGALDGNYTVVGEFVVHDIFDGGENVSSASFTNDLACGASGDGGDDPIASGACLNRARYWHGHPEMWPVTKLMVGGHSMDQAELLVALDRDAPNVDLFGLTRQLIAAELNLANGGDSDIRDVVDASNALLMNYGENARNRGQARSEANHLEHALHSYNRGGCPDDETSGETLGLDGGFDTMLAKSANESADKAAVEVLSLGSIKAMYR